ncbi:MAG: nucleotide pyrophosphatase/phosphodiesterase family protein, partial [Tepidisphaeraceae bacterium]
MPVPNHCPLRHLLASCLMSAISMAATAAEPGRHVVAIVCDGLRPDLVTEADMPILTRLGRDGVFFANHHPVYISSTEVNGTALATGVYPRTSGVIANHEYRPDIELLQPIDTEHPWAAWQADRLSGGQYIKTDTIAELLQRTGRHTVVAGTKGVALLWDRKYRPTDASSPRLFEGITRPAALLDSIEPDMGPLPLRANPKAAANARQDEWTTRVLTERLWSNGIPAFTVLWLSEPDFAQHGSGPGTAVGRAALRSSDANIGRMIEALRMAGELDKTDILVMSDHGFSTVSRHLEMPDLLDQAGFKVVTDADRNLAPGEVMPVSTSGSVLFYVGGHDAKVAADLVAFLQKSDFAGVIFTQQPQFGTFPLSQVRMDSPA